jgi:hypothetical protein
LDRELARVKKRRFGFLPGRLFFIFFTGVVNWVFAGGFEESGVQNVVF